MTVEGHEGGPGRPGVRVEDDLWVQGIGCTAATGVLDGIGRNLTR